MRLRNNSWTVAVVALIGASSIPSAAVGQPGQESPVPEVQQQPAKQVLPEQYNNTCIERLLNCQFNRKEL